MTLSSGSRQHRKSMLPTPRLSSRLGSRRVALSDTSRITRRVPSPLSTTPYDNGSTAQARIPQPAAANHNLPLPELGTRQAGAPSRIPGPSGQTSCPTPEQCSASSLTGISTPRPEVKRAADILYPTPPPSAEPKDEQRQERRATSVQKQEPEPRNPAASSARRPHHNAVTKRPTSTAFAVGFSRVENTVTSPSDASAALAQKRSALTSSVSEKENRRPHIRTRVPAPPVAASASASAAPVTVVISVPQPRCIRRMVAVVAPPSRVSFRETLPRPLVIQKRPSHSSEVSSSQGDSRVKLTAAAAAPVVVVVIPAGINALIEDIDRFAKEWTDTFDELSAGPERGPSKLISSMRIYPTGQSKAPFGSATPVGTQQASTLDGTSRAGLQHGDYAMVKYSPVEDRPERDLLGLGSDPPVLRDASFPITPQASRYHPPLPEINQSLLISGSHLAEMTPVGSLNRKDELTKLPESQTTTPRSTDTARRNGIARHARYFPPATLPGVSFSTIASLSSTSSPYSISPWTNLQGHYFSPQRSLRAASDSVPTRSSSLRGLRAIFKRTSAGLTGGQRQRAESLKGLISEPRVLSLGSVSITNLRDAGIAGGCGQVESTVTTGELARKATVK